MNNTKNKKINERRNQLYAIYDLMKTDPYSAKFEVARLLNFEPWSEFAEPLDYEEITLIEDKKFLKSYDDLLYRIYKAVLEEIEKKEYPFVDENGIRRKYIL